MATLSSAQTQTQTYYPVEHHQSPTATDADASPNIMPPPPYTRTKLPQHRRLSIGCTDPSIYTDVYADDAGADTDTDIDPDLEPDTLEIDATTTIAGTAYIGSIGADAAIVGCRAVGALYAALNKHMVAAADPFGGSRSRRPLKIRLQCGVRVVGARNGVGCVGVGVRHAVVPGSAASTREGKVQVPVPGGGDDGCAEGQAQVLGGAGGSIGRGGGKRKAEDEEDGGVMKAVKTEGVEDGK